MEPYLQKNNKKRVGRPRRIWTWTKTFIWRWVMDKCYMSSCMYISICTHVGVWGQCQVCSSVTLHLTWVYGYMVCVWGCVWAYVCTVMCLSVCVCAYHSTHVRSSENSLRYQSSPSTLLEAGPLCCLDATHIGQLVHWLLVILSSLPISLWESWDCRCLCNVSGFSMDSEELDSGPHTQEASTLTHKPSSLTLPPCYWFSFWCRISPWPGAHWFS